MFKVETYGSLDGRLEATRRRITGSKIPQILGLGYQGQSPLSVWLEMTGRSEQGFTEEQAWELDVRRGVEPLVIQRCAAELDDRLVIYPQQESTQEIVLRSQEYACLSCTPDAYAIPEEGVEALSRGDLQRLEALSGIEGVEAKTYRFPSIPESWEHEPSQYAVVQAHWGMAITGWDRWHVPVMFGLGSAYRRYVIERDGEICDQLISTALEFFDLVERDEAPGDKWLDGATETKQALIELYPPPEEKSETVIDLHDLDPDLAYEILCYEDIAESIKDLESSIARIQAVARDRMGKADATSVVFRNGGENVLKFNRSVYERKGYEVKPTTVDSLRKVKS